MQIFLQRCRFNDDQFQSICDSLLIRKGKKFTNLFVVAYYINEVFQPSHSKIKRKNCIQITLDLEEQFGKLKVRDPNSVFCDLPFGSSKTYDNMPLDLSYIKRFVDLSIVGRRTFKGPK